jgi:hypothetical protein
MLQGDAVTRRIPLDERTLRQIPSARALVEDPRWLALTGYVASFELRPLAYVQTIFARARAATEDPQTSLHADTFHSTVKAWLFLHDVGLEEGPFVYVPGSHRVTPQLLSWAWRKSIEAGQADFLTSRGSFRISEDELGEIGLGPPRAIAVEANTLVVADTSGFHARGHSERPTVRTEIWAYGRSNPFLPWTGTPMPSWLSDRVVDTVWGLTDLGEQVGLKANPWRAVGPVGPRTSPDMALWPEAASGQSSR